MPQLQRSRSKQAVDSYSGSDLDVTRLEGHAGFKGLFENQFM